MKGGGATSDRRRRNTTEKPRRSRQSALACFGGSLLPASPRSCAVASPSYVANLSLLPPGASQRPYSSAACYLPAAVAVCT